MTIVITVLGKPAPQGSKVMMRHKQSGNMIMLESGRKTTQPWREAVKSAAVEVAERHDCPLTGPVQVSMTFAFPRPKSHYLPANSKRPHPVLRPGVDHHPTGGAGDLSKLVRSTEDALTDAAVWLNDNQVVRCNAEKRYVSLGSPAGAIIIISPVTMAGPPPSLALAEPVAAHHVHCQHEQECCYCNGATHCAVPRPVSELRFTKLEC